MDIAEFESDWKKIMVQKKDKSALELMTKVKSHPRIKRMRLKLMIEFMALTLFLFLYYDGFDGHSKPLWSNILLVTMAVIYIATRIIGWHTLRNPIKADNLRESMESLYKKLKRIAIWNILASFFLAVGVILFFSSVIVFAQEKCAMLIGMILFLGVFLIISSRNWITQISAIRRTLGGF